MKLSSANVAAIRRLVRCAELYWSPNQRNVGWNNRIEWQRARTDWRTALLLSRSYWFERVPAIQQYADAAQVIYERPSLTPERIDEKYIAKAHTQWVRESERRGARINQKLYGRGDPATDLLHLVKNAPDGNIIRWGVERLSVGDVAGAARTLADLPGVSSKIAAFWLRDVSDAFQLPTDSCSDPEYLQPIDRWVYRFVQGLTSITGCHLPTKLTDSAGSYWAAASCMVTFARAAEVRPTSLNSAVWFISKFLDDYWNSDGWSAASLITETGRFDEFEEYIRSWFEWGKEYLKVVANEGIIKTKPSQVSKWSAGTRARKAALTNPTRARLKILDRKCKGGVVS